MPNEPSMLMACLGLAVAVQTQRAPGAVAAGPVTPQPMASLEMTVHIEWREAAPLPVVMNGGMVGKTGSHIVYATAFGRKGPKEILSSGYTQAAWAYSLDADTWARIPDFPGAPRGYGTASGLSDDEHAYVLGGQSYAEPYVYKDVYRVSREDGAWRWQRLPDMLWPTAEFGACTLGGKLYVQGGAFWGVREPGKLGTGYWCTQTGRVGVRFQVLDLADLDAGWKELPSLPGVHRTHHTLSAAAGKLYCLGGIAIRGQERDPGRRGTYNTVDCWCYDPAARTWTRVRDTPLPLGGHAALTYRDRYVLLMGGYSGRKVLGADDTARPPYGDCQGFEDRVFVYGTVGGRFSLATPMLHKINDPRPEWIDNHTLFEATGEIPKGNRIPNCQIGTVVSVAGD